MTPILPFRTANTTNIPLPIMVRPPDMSSAAVHAQVLNAVDNFFSSSQPHQAVSAPMNCDRFQSTDVTPQFEMGVDDKAFNINGELMLEITPVSAQNGTPTWYDLGKMPTSTLVDPIFPN